MARLDAPIRPPPALAEEGFRAACDGCAACARACPEAIIVSDRAGRPVLDVSAGPCTFCGACADACPTGALDVARAAAWSWRAVAADTCLSVNGVSCRACEDGCDARAIRFRLQTGGRATPVVDLDLCTGCGGCVGDCPVGAMALKTFTPEHAEALS